MDKKTLAYFKELILHKRQELLREMGIVKESSLKNTNKEASGNDATFSTHMADQGTDAQEREKAFYYASRDHKYLNHLDEALERIENGTFGSCTECGKDIPKERLEAVPIARKCVPCKLLEKQ